MEPRRVSTAALLIDELDAKRPTLSCRQPGWFRSEQKAWSKDTGDGMLNGKSSIKGSQQIAKDKSKDTRKGQLRP